MIKGVFEDLSREFRVLGSNYQGIFLTNVQGDLYTGVLSGGSEYKGSNLSDVEYFQSVRRSGETVFSEIVISKNTGKPIAVACAPVKNKRGEFLGVLGLAINSEYLTQVVSDRKNRQERLWVHGRQKRTLHRPPQSQSCSQNELLRHQGDG